MKTEGATLARQSRPPLPFDSCDIKNPSCKKNKKSLKRKGENKGDKKVRPRGEIRRPDPRKNKEWRKQQRPHYC